MEKKKKKKRTIVSSLVLVAAMLSAPSAQAQGMLDLLGEYYEEQDQRSTRDGGMMGRGSSGGYNLSNQQFGSDANGGYELFNQTFGQETPVGSGLAILMVAGMGYAAMKSRKKNQKSNN
jgi:hypothetical protein